MKKITTVLLAAVFVFLLAGCGNNNEKTGTSVNEKTEVPGDFAFSFTWGCNGDSTYDSVTGELVKQKIATDLKAYTTTFFLSDEQKAEIYGLIVKMEPEKYPDEYDPLQNKSKPSRDIILSVTVNGNTKTIVCRDVSLDNAYNGVMGKKFMEVHDAIVAMLTDSEEWKALPDYEFYYD